VHRPYTMMKFDPQIHQRRSIRLMDFDYSQAGAYFVTLVRQEQTNLCGEIVVDGVMKLINLS
jgi:REP-associated tyrosine transposase